MDIEAGKWQRKSCSKISREHLYIIDTQDEKWLRQRQKKTINATHVSSVKQIKEALSKASLEYLNVI